MRALCVLPCVAINQHDFDEFPFSSRCDGAFANASNLFQELRFENVGGFLFSRTRHTVAVVDFYPLTSFPFISNHFRRREEGTRSVYFSDKNTRRWLNIRASALTSLLARERASSMIPFLRPSLQSRQDDNPTTVFIVEGD